MNTARAYYVYVLASVHVETFASPQEAIAREKQLKNWRCDWKIELIEKENLDWSDLSGLI
jgi:putative endonuclease